MPPSPSAVKFSALVFIMVAAACGGGTEPPPGTDILALEIRPVVGADTIVHPDTDFQLRLVNAAGNPVSLDNVSWASDNAAVLEVSSTGWAEAIAPGSAEVSATSGGETLTQRFIIDPSAVVSGPDFFLSGAFACTGFACPPGNVLIEGWIGHSADVRVRMEIVGDYHFSAADQVTFGVSSAPCQTAPQCIGVGNSLNFETQIFGSFAELCVQVGLGDSVPPTQGPVVHTYYLAPGSWTAVWDAPPLFQVRKQFQIYVDASVLSPINQCF